MTSLSNNIDRNRDGSSKIPLSYYWPKDIPKRDAMLTFANTPKIIRFFEEYFGIKYPYKKYSQVAIEEFELGGMENTNCTMLTKYILHDEIAAIDYTRDIDVVSHELAHQWFGDLVTCRDWSNLWLNEGFATYCQWLYWESIKGFDDFSYKVIKMADEYLEESRRLYKRALVTRIYKYPDELFDTHSYEKGGCILHMLRCDIDDNNFRKSINVYLDSHKNKTAETDDLRKIVEDVSGKSMRQFFDQWVYRSGSVSKSFRNVIASGAIDGLKELSVDKNKDTVVDIANFLIENTDTKNDYFKRLAATSALSKFLRTKKDNDEENTKLKEMNRKVFNCLLGLLKDKRQGVKFNACRAFADPDIKPSILDNFIRSIE